MIRDPSVEAQIAYVESRGVLVPGCPSCDRVRESILAGKGWPFAPGHKPSDRCESGKHPHCSCDTCF